jgi:hypothetical protein
VLLAPPSCGYYEVDLERFTTRDATLDWLLPLSGKDEAFQLHGFVRALSDVMGYGRIQQDGRWSRRAGREAARAFHWRATT